MGSRVRLLATEYGRCEYGITDDYVHVFNLWIYPQYRGMGHARNLIKMAILLIRLDGHRGEIQIVADPGESSIDLDRLSRFYTNSGLAVYDYYG